MTEPELIPFKSVVFRKDGKESPLSPMLYFGSVSKLTKTIACETITSNMYTIKPDEFRSEFMILSEDKAKAYRIRYHKAWRLTPEGENKER